MKIEKLIEVVNELESTLMELQEQGLAVRSVRAKIMEDVGSVDVVVDADQNVTVNPQK